MDLFMIREEEGGPEFLSDNPEGYPFCRPARPEEVTLADLADLLDMKAEDANYHGFVGSHAWLAGVLERRCSPGQALAVLLEILAAGGLHKVARR